MIDENGQVKLCDFGISGNLINSNAKSRNNAGCAGYMAPERIEPKDPRNPVYDIRADVWSLGITLVELANGLYPYIDCKHEFEVMSTIVQCSAPRLDENRKFSLNFVSFVNKCLIKDVEKRPKYNILLQDPFVLEYKEVFVDIKKWLKNEIESNEANLTPGTIINLTVFNDCESASTTPTATNSFSSFN